MSQHPFVHLHVHTSYSLQDSACRLKALVEKAAELNFPALAITDHANLFGAIDFFIKCKDKNIRPILGCEFYVILNGNIKTPPQTGQEQIGELILLAKNNTGFSNLRRLVTVGYLEGLEDKPRIDRETLSAHRDGLIALTGGMNGILSRLLKDGQTTLAKKELHYLIETYGKENLYVELQNHGEEGETEIRRQLKALAEEHDLACVATNGVHYLQREHADAHDALMAMQHSSTLDDPMRIRYESAEYYLKSADEMAALFADEPEALANTVKIAEQCEVDFEFGKLRLPYFEPPEGMGQHDYLRSMCLDGLKNRYGELTEKAMERLDHELKVIEQLGYSSYFLIVWDFVNFAKKQLIPVGPGRGSAAGSIVSYALGITDIDPLTYDLLFERFLNPERVTFPDIDIDFCYERRNEVIDYVIDKYGKTNVAQIITFGTMQAKAVVRDVARTMRMSYGEADRLAKLIPNELDITLTRALEEVEELKSLYETDEQIRQLIDYALVLEGLTRHASIHAAGITVADKPLIEYTPLFKSHDGQITTGHDMGSLEKIGILKVDMLGLRTLTVIDHAIKWVKKNRNIDVDIDAISLADDPTFGLLARAETIGIFQLESAGMRELLRKIKPTQFEDIVSVIALYRPGPIGSGMLDDFMRRKHGMTPIVYPHPQLESTLDVTYGVIVYQEQVMRIASDLAGFTLAQADLLRRAMGKKNPEVMIAQRKAFLEGCKNNKVDPDDANKIFDLMEHFAGYGFNKSHSVAYAAISYQTAYLKANFPVEFMTALLSSEYGNTDKLVLYLDEAKRMGIRILPPDINHSQGLFTVVDNQTIRCGLGIIKNVGLGAVESMVKVRSDSGAFQSLADLCARIDHRQVNRKVLESLIKTGAMDCLNQPRAALLANLDHCIDEAMLLQRDRALGQMTFFGDMPMSAETDAVSPETKSLPSRDWPDAQKLAFEKALMGFYVSGHPLDAHSKMLRMFSPYNSVSLGEVENGQMVVLGGMLTKVKRTVTKKTNENMAICVLEDLSGRLEVVVFPASFSKVAPNLIPNSIVFVEGRLSKRDDQPKIMAERLIPLEQAGNQLIKALDIELSADQATPDHLDQLKSVLLRFPGVVPVFLNVPVEDQPRMRLRLADSFKVEVCQGLIDEIETLIGEDQCRVQRREPAQPEPFRRSKRSAAKAGSG